MAKTRQQPKTQGARAPRPVWTDLDGRKRTLGVMGDMEHGELMLDGRLVEMLTSWSFAELNRLAETIRTYAIGHELVSLTERVERLEKKAKPQRTVRRARRAA